MPARIWCWPACWTQTRSRRRQDDLVHLRDFAGTQLVPLGLGEVPLGLIVAMLLGLIVAMLPGLSHLRWVVVEQDPDSSAPGTDMSASRAFLRERLFL